MSFRALLLLSWLNFAASGFAEVGLKWDSVLKERTAKEGDTNLVFQFQFTNKSPTSITVSKIGLSCGCTVARATDLPWSVSPGGTGNLEIDMDVRGKYGTVTKAVTVETSAGTEVLTVRAQIPFQPPTNSSVSATFGNQHSGGKPTGAEQETRSRNLLRALADRQAVFRGDCAKCHAEPAKGKVGAELYAAACGVCHDSQHRASMVPDLQKLNKPTDREYWRKWISDGRAGSLMPAFIEKLHGPLTAAQVESLVEYLAVPKLSQQTKSPSLGR